MFLSNQSFHMVECKVIGLLAAGVRVSLPHLRVPMGCLDLLGLLVILDQL